MSVCDAPPMTILHLGCGRKQTFAQIGLQLVKNGQPIETDGLTLINLDRLADVKPDIVCDVGKDRIDLPDDSVDVILALHVLEHIGRQGEMDEWFHAFEEMYRVLKPSGIIRFECPYYSSCWAWADPTHTRAISEYSFLYLNQDAYKETGTAMPDYRPNFDFVLQDWFTKQDCNPEVVAKEGDKSHIVGSLVARKPLQPYWVTDARA